MDSLIYQRQQDLDIYVNYHVVLVGAGGVGTWFAHIATMAGLINTLAVFDDDRIETHNLNRLPYPQEWTGRPKVEALKDHITRLRDDVKIHIYNTKFDPVIADAEKPHVVVSTVDNPTAHEQVAQYAKDRVIKYIKLACSAQSITSTTRISTWNGGDTTTGYEGIKIWVAPTIMAALGGVYALAANTDVNLIANPLELYKGGDIHG